MGEAVLGAFLPVLLEKLDREITEYFGRLKVVDKKVLKKWTRKLRAIEAVLSDAEEKQLTQRAVKEWLDDLRDLAYDVQDVLDIFDTKMLKRRIERQQGSKSKLWSPLSKVKSNFGLNSAIEKISEGLEEITTRKEEFGLTELGVSKKPWKMPPTTSQPDGPVIGRGKAKDKILSDLLSEQENYHVVGIVGTGGLGKTTLAKHVFNDAATSQFSPKGWVYVSGDFDIVRVAAAVLESVTSAPVPKFRELNSILEKLSKELACKKFLIVLDDVWDTCSDGQWTTLQASFRVGAAGSKIIVTTRDAKVAKMMGDSSPYNLKPMSEDECWELFQHHAQLKNRPEDVEFLKEKIVEKCNGLPLAARTLGGLLRCKEVDEWEGILAQKMWDLSDQNKMDIIPALKLSYHYLPSTLKRCFSYCAILPNDYEFEEMQLVFYWMAEGLIQQQPEENKQLEDLGRGNFQELVSRSLFQKSSKTESRYIMHDLVTDLARWAAGSSCSRLEEMQNCESQRRCLQQVRHSSFIPGEDDGVKKFEVYSEATCLRTFLPLSLRNSNYLAQKVTSDLLPKLQYLRLLSLKSYKIIELPDTIGKMKHLRYLDLSHTGIRSLPDSTTTLYNLQTLLLKSCDQLKALPTSMRNLVNLRHLNNSGTRSLKEMPPQLGQLTNLQTLPEFVIGKGSGSGVREIESLLHLQGTLHISRLENVICVEDARSANCLKSKERLEALFLEWSSSSVSTKEDAAIVLDMLQPHSKLKELTIKGYGGSNFSTWIGNPSFTNMVRVKLEGCNHCQFLPPFGQLPRLKELCIQNMNAVESVGVEFYGEGNLSFHVLETLELHFLKNWKKWYPCQQSEGVKVFSCLKKLSIKHCSKLEGDLPENLDSLAQLEIRGCEELVGSVSKYKQLHGSNIKKFKTVVCNTSMGEAVLGAFLLVLLEKLADQEITEYFGRLMVDKKVLEKWTSTLKAIEAVLSDAEEKQLTQRAVKEWLDDLRDLAYDVQDVLDIFDTKMLKRRIERQQGSKSKLWSPLSKVKSNFGLNSAIKKISDRLEEITTRKEKFGLTELGVSKKPWKMPPTTSQPDGPVIGRGKAKDKILSDLLSEQENYHVVGIVGTGGLGKTTLAKHVFNDAATGQFSPKGWVSVSDDFDIVRVAAAVLESVTSAPVQEFKDLNSILEKLSEELAGKKFLIVLDDVWHTCSDGQWTTLQASFRVGAAGSKIIVTTRDANVAKMMGDSSPYKLKPMSEDDCWRLFQYHARLTNRPEDVELLKEKIVEKCDGLPLAARTLGGLLRCKEVDEWEDILDHKMWTLSDQNKVGILPALKLSYHYLPSTLKRCFSYCAILPDDYEFEEMQLILWWMAEGLIPQQPNEHKQMEDLGRDYFQELVSRSLFQKSSKTESRYIMNDLVTDLARWAAGSSCSRLEDMQNYDSQHRCLPKVRHSSFIPGEYDGVKKFEVYSEATCLRTFLPLSLSLSFWNYNCLAQKVTSDLLPELHYLRLLSLNGYQITELPDTIGELKHLRYLDLSHTRIRSLPDSTTTLYNLQTLLLESCHQLKALPTSMRNLVTLRHLNNSETSSLEEMPPQLGQLTNLQTLPEFVIGKGSGSGVREIESLSHLQGTLHISRLENVICLEDARSANLKSKERLEALFLEWSSSSVSTEDAAIVLDMLQPHSKLKKLTIKGYGGSKFSTWIGNPSFTKMVRVKLEGCNHCQFLPPFGQLPCLKELCIQEMDAVESVGVEFYGEGDLSFQALETLEFWNLKNWKKWYPCQQSEGVEVFSCLKKLSIKDCSKLEGDLPENLDSLAQLEICGCEELVVSVSKYKQLHGSNIEKCKMVVYDTSTVQFELLESLTYSNVSELRFQTEAFMKSLKNVKELKITGCEELTCCFQNEDRLLQHLISLGHLYIEDNSILVEKLGKEAEQLVKLQILDCKIERLELSKCGRLLMVPEGLHHLRSLKELHISECSSLVSFPDVSLPPCLQVIVIWDCESLSHFAKYQIPPSLKRIVIGNCGNLKSLIEKEEEVGNGSSSSCLEHLEIRECPSLMCLLCKGQLPRSLKRLRIVNCGQLELITERFLDDSCQLEVIYIWKCPNLKSLPEGLCHLTNLQSLIVEDCQSLVSLPRMNVWPREIWIENCDKLEVAQLARDMMHTSNLEDLRIDYFEGLTTTTSFPTNLTSLTINKIKNCKALMESQGLQRFTSLRELRLRGEDDGGLVSFPPAAENSKETEILLPRSLVVLEIEGFPNLKKLSKGFQFLTSLESIWIWSCPKLTTLPVEEGLPLSQLEIRNCPLLEQRYKGRYRHKIAHIPCVLINGELI
ncbi:hypothetical protein ACLB2K_070296 [Fragaria x ananassa]